MTLISDAVCLEASPEMATVQAWLNAARPRTLPLAFSAILTGGSLAWSHGQFRWPVFALSMVTAVLLQILSNFANDFGDFSKGADSQHRVGPARTMQSALISKREMTAAIVTTVALTLVAGYALLAISIREKASGVFLLFVLLGLLAVAAAIFYTVGRRPYGYHGYGDVSVFLFFGLTGVAGSFYLHANGLEPEVLLIASAVGLLSTGVLNINNMRDSESDRLAGKRTLVARIGIPWAKRYHAGLVIGALFFAATYTVMVGASVSVRLLILSPFVLLAKNAADIFRNTNPSSFDKYLARQVGFTLLFALLFGAGTLLNGL
jgi:1,4-dihydroxy-2-naphthoate octaprenyltransferase